MASLKRSRDEGANAASQEAARRLAEDQQHRLRLTRDGPVNPDTKDFCGSFAAIDLDNSWDLAAFKKGFRIEITKLTDEHVEFDMIGIDAPLANAVRRILIAEVPTIAVGQVTMWQNTGVIHDENLAHRMGLIPFKIDPDVLDWRRPGSDFDETNSLRFSLHVTCSEEEGKKSVYSRDLVWQPWSTGQERKFRDAPPRPVAEDILIAQLRSGQEIECELYLEKGIGKEHAKWSPVCTAFYRLLPVVELTKDILNEDADKLREVCPKGTVDIEELASGSRRAKIVDARSCSTCRECLESFNGEEKGLILGKVKNHFLFSVESTGCIPAPLLLTKALDTLKGKAETAMRVLEAQQRGGHRPADASPLASASASDGKAGASAPAPGG